MLQKVKILQIFEQKKGRNFLAAAKATANKTAIAKTKRKRSTQIESHEYLR